MAKQKPQADVQPPLRLEWRSPAELAEHPSNWRRHPEQQIAALTDGIAEVGWAGACLLNERSGRLIDGHLRKKVGLARGDALVPVLIGSWTEEQEKTILATLDPIAAMATADSAALDALLRDIDSNSEALQQMLADLAASARAVEPTMTEGMTDPDAVPAPPDEAITKPGDLWLLGRHRLLCGDSSKPEDVDRLLDGAAIHLVNCDPPYNVRVEPRSNNAIAAGLSSFPADAKPHYHGFDLARDKQKGTPTTKKLRAKDRPLANDFVSDEEFDRLLNAWFGNMARVLMPGRAFYIWGGYANCGNYPPVLKATGLYFSQAIIWDKQHPVLTRKDYMGAHEWCFYGWREDAAHQYFGPNNATDLWAIKKVNPQSMVHLTEKPVELASRAIEYSSRVGENVLDLFGGSGSTLIAAEQMKRKAFLMELDRLYCDVIVQRYENFTGKKAKRKAA